MKLVPLLVAGLLGCTEATELFVGETAANCATPGPVVHLGGADAGSCASARAAQLGTHALCTCDSLVLTGALSTELPPGQLGGLASIATNGDLRVSGPSVIRGSATIAGSGGVQLRGGHIFGSVQSAGILSSQAMGTLVDLDAYAGGDVSGALMIGGLLHVPAGTAVGPGVFHQGLVQEPVSVVPPCDCDNTAFDIAAAVSDRKTRNANASLPFGPDFLVDVTKAQTVDWSCGEFYLPEIRTNSGASLEFRVHGHVGLFIDGDVRLGDNLSLTFDPDAELDLVVAGSFYTLGRVFGAPSRPGKLRLWIASTTVSLPDQIQFAAFVYAPSAVFSAGPGLTFGGALFVQTVAIAGDVHIFYDPLIALSDPTCGS